MSETQTNAWTGSMTLGDGSVVTGATMEEAFQKLAQMKVDTHNALKAEREAKAELEKQSQQYQQQIQTLQQPPKPKGNNNEFDRDEYYRLLNADPVAANDYYFQYRFGRSPEEFNNEYQRIGQSVSVLEQQTMAAAFAAQHAEDWPASPEAAKALRTRVEHLTQNENFRFGIETMNYAYDQLVSEGVIKPVEHKETETPNPQLKGGGGQIPDDIAKAETMSDKELTALMRKHGMFQ